MPLNFRIRVQSDGGRGPSSPGSNHSLPSASSKDRQVLVEYPRPEGGGRAKDCPVLAGRETLLTRDSICPARKETRQRSEEGFFGIACAPPKVVRAGNTLLPSYFYPRGQPVKLRQPDELQFRPALPRFVPMGKFTSRITRGARHYRLFSNFGGLRLAHGSVMAVRHGGDCSADLQVGTVPVRSG